MKGRIKDAKQRIQRINTEEEEIAEEEERESAELQKLKKLSERLESSSSKDKLLREEITDFEEAVRLVENISEGLDQTAKDLHKTVEEISQTSDRLVGILNQLENREVTIGHQEAGYLKESLNANHSTVEDIIRESREAKKEAKNLRSEISSLIDLDRFIEKIDYDDHDLSKPERTLKKVKNQTDSTVQKLERIENEVQDAENRDKQAFNKISRREAISRGAATVAALSTLPGVKAAEADGGGSRKRSLDEKLREITLRTGEAAELETGDTVELEEIRETEALLDINGQLVTPGKGEVLQLESTRIKVDKVFKGSQVGLVVINVGDIAAETVRTLGGDKRSAETNRSEITIETGETVEISGSKTLTAVDVNRDAVMLRVVENNEVENVVPKSSGEVLDIGNNRILVKTIFIGAEMESVILQIQ